MADFSISSNRALGVSEGDNYPLEYVTPYGTVGPGDSLYITVSPSAQLPFTEELDIPVGELSNYNVRTIINGVSSPVNWVLDGSFYQYLSPTNQIVNFQITIANNAFSESGSGIEFLLNTGVWTAQELNELAVFSGVSISGSGGLAVDAADKSETAIVPLTFTGTTAQTSNSVTDVIRFSDPNSSPSPSVSFSSSYTATNSQGQAASVTAAQQTALNNLGFQASIDPNKSQVDWSFNTQYTPQTSANSPGPRYQDPLAGYNFSVTENVRLSDPTAGSDTSSVTLNITGAPSVTELAELSANAYLVKHYSVPRFTLYDRDNFTDGFSATASLSADGTQMVVAFRGTDLDNAALKNLLADASFTTGTPTPQLTSYVNDAVSFVETVAQEAAAEGYSTSITLTGHSLGAAIAELLGQKLGLTAIGFDAVGAGALSNSFASLNGAKRLGSSTDLENYRLQGDQISLVGAKIGAQYTVANSGNTVDLLDALNFTYHDSLTLADRLAAGVTPQAGYASIDPNYYGIAASVAFPIVQHMTYGKLILNVAFAAAVGANSYIDPSSGYSFDYEQSAGSPNLSSITLPNLPGVANYSVQQEVLSGSIEVWLAPQILAPDTTLTLAANTTGIKFESLDSSGNPIQVPDGFTFAAGFQNPGQVSATITAQSEIASDFNGNATADVLLQSSNSVIDWVMQNGSYASYNSIGNSSGYQVVGSGNFNNDATADVLLESSSGNVIDWLMHGGTYQSYTDIGNSNGYTVKTIGDFNGDGTSDVLLQNGTNVIDWILHNGAYQSYNTIGTTADYGIVGTGDFSGNGTTDILLENGTGTVIDWMMQNGVYQTYNTVGNASGYGVVGTGDFNGDGSADILLENGAGNVIDWIIQNGQFAGWNEIGSAAGYGIVATGDYEGKGGMSRPMLK